MARFEPLGRRDHAPVPIRREIGKQLVYFDAFAGRRAALLSTYSASALANLLRRNAESV